MKKEKRGLLNSKKEKNFIKKPFLMGFVCSILVLLTSIISNIFSFFNLLKIQGFFYLASFFLYLVILASFYYLGKKYNNPLIKNTSIILAIISIAFFFVFIGMSINTINKLKANEDLVNKVFSDSLNDQEIDEETSLKIASIFLPLILFFIIFYLIFLITYTFFSIGLINLKVKFSKFLGIIYLLVFWFPILVFLPSAIIFSFFNPLSLIVFLSEFFIYFFILLAAGIFPILLFYSEAKKAGEI